MSRLFTENRKDTFRKVCLEGGKRVIPVLVGGADIPRAEDLPDELKLLARRQVIRITLERFKVDAKRQAEEAARAAERERQEAEGARQQALEVENWAFVKDKYDPAELRDHIARSAGGSTERFAAEMLAALVRAGLGAAPAKAALALFLDEFPKAREAGEARAGDRGLGQSRGKHGHGRHRCVSEGLVWRRALIDLSVRQTGRQLRRDKRHTKSLILLVAFMSRLNRQRFRPAQRFRRDRPLDPCGGRGGKAPRLHWPVP